MEIDEEHLFWGTARGVLFIYGVNLYNNLSNEFRNVKNIHRIKVQFKNDVFGVYSEHNFG